MPLTGIYKALLGISRKREKSVEEHQEIFDDIDQNDNFDAYVRVLKKYVLPNKKIIITGKIQEGTIYINSKGKMNDRKFYIRDITVSNRKAKSISTNETAQLTIEGLRNYDIRIDEVLGFRHP